jgi:hypothetical protein
MSADGLIQFVRMYIVKKGFSQGLINEEAKHLLPSMI